MAGEQPPAGPAYWDALVGPQKDGQYPEYVSPDVWMGEYVEKLEQKERSSEREGATSQDSTGGQQAVPPAKLPRWKRRTAEQIEANKAAQKRFREKKKARLAAQAGQVEQLSQRMEGLSQLEADSQALEAQNAELESSLWAKEAELHQLKVELDQKTPQAAYDRKARGRWLAALRGPPSSLDARIAKVAQRWREEKERLEALLTDRGLAPGAAVSEADAAALAKQSLAVMQQCMEILTLGGPQLDALLRTYADREEDLLRRNSLGQHTRLAAALQLSPQQTAAVLALRQDVLARLERLYVDRQGLNMRVMALLAAAGGGGGGGAGELRAALAQLQANLVQEQRLEAEHHHGVFRRILTPLQGARFIVNAYPEHCDTLAFMHGVHALQQEQQQ